jgi:hypothetical protein
MDVLLPARLPANGDRISNAATTVQAKIRLRFAAWPMLLPQDFAR